MVIDSRVFPKLVQLLNHREVKIQTVAARAVGNIVAGNDYQTQTVPNCFALSYFHKLLNHPTEKIRKEALCDLSNVTAGNCAQVQTVINAAIIPLIINHLEKGEFQTQKAAARAVSNMAIRGNKQQVTYLINCGVIPPFCNLLKCKDSEVIQDVLDGIHDILKMSVNQDDGDNFCALIEDCGGLEEIKSLQNHENIAISKTSYEIMED